MSIIEDEDRGRECPECGEEMHYRMIDVDGTNLEEMEVCEECKYGYPADYEDEEENMTKSSFKKFFKEVYK